MKTCGSTQSLGQFTQGEKPAPLVYQFLDDNGVPINLTGYTVKFQWRQQFDGAATTLNGSLADAVNGKVQVTWTGLEFANTGSFEGQFWAGNMTNLFASDVITWSVRRSVGPVPAI